MLIKNIYEGLRTKYEENEFYQIIGKSILNVYISDDKTLIMFQTLDRDTQYKLFITSGDCCNQVWIEHINGVENLWGQVVLEVMEKDSKDMGWDEKRDAFLEKILYTFRTKKGYCDIELRNSHNGYYGGCLSPYIDFNQMPIMPDPEIVWKKVIEDF